MSPGEVAFLIMVVVAMSLFAIAIAYASFVAGGSSTSPVRRKPSLRARSLDSSAAVSNAQASKGETVVASIR